MILDASAILAVLLRETGQQIVEQAFEASAMICSVNLAEAATVLIRQGIMAVDVDTLLGGLPLIVQPADDELALAAARLYPITRPFGLSLADRFCLALAARESSPALTGDRAWVQAGPLLNVDVRLIR